MRRLGMFGHGEDGSNYLASVSDLMSGLIFVFIITLMVFAFAYKQQEEEYREQEEFLTNTEEIRSELLADLKKALEDAGITVEVDTEQGILHLPEEILFPSGQAVLTGQGAHAIDVLSSELAYLLPCYTGLADRERTRPTGCNEDRWYPGRVDTVLIEGHTDDVPLKAGSAFRDNWYLSSARSIETYDTLMLGDSGSTLRTLQNRQEKPVFGVSGYADLRGRGPNDTGESRARNRRIDLRFIMAPPRIEVIE